MKYVFWGSPEFSRIILKKLIEANFIPSAIVCNPDKPVGRKKIITPPPVKSFIIKHKTWNMDVLQPEKLDKNFMVNVSSFMPDIFIVAAYSKIITKEILAIPRLGTIGVHPSLLPKYRGSSPIQSVILNGEEKTGVTLYLMDEKMDHGPILTNNELPVRQASFDSTQDKQIANRDNYENLMKKLAELGGDLLVKILPKFIAGEIEPKTQDESLVTYTKKFKTEDAYIEPKNLEDALKNGGEVAYKIERMVRALNPEPGAYTFINNKRTKILDAVIESNKLKLRIIQKEGKSPETVK